MKKFVAIAGNIGVGKSTLVSLLSHRLGWQPFFEPVCENPYLADFYRDMSTWAYHSQIFFLTQRLHDHRQLIEHPTSAIQDRTVYEDAEVFARNLYLQGYFNPRDYQAYCELYNVLKEFLLPPDLVVFLRADVKVLLERIANRGRDYERRIGPDYLSQLNQLYDEWIATFNLCPVLTVPAGELDYVTYPGHLDLICHKVEEKLTGKEEVIFERLSEGGWK
jgi:deoxyadenosine/deoxycytidine kinase